MPTPTPGALRSDSGPPCGAGRTRSARSTVRNMEGSPDDTVSGVAGGKLVGRYLSLGRLLEAVEGRRAERVRSCSAAADVVVLAGVGGAGPPAGHSGGSGSQLGEAGRPLSGRRRATRLPPPVSGSCRNPARVHGSGSRLVVAGGDGPGRQCIEAVAVRSVLLLVVAGERHPVQYVPTRWGTRNLNPRFSMEYWIADDLGAVIVVAARGRCRSGDARRV